MVLQGKEEDSFSTDDIKKKAATAGAMYGTDKEDQTDNDDDGPAPPPALKRRRTTNGHKRGGGRTATLVDAVRDCDADAAAEAAVSATEAVILGKKCKRQRGGGSVASGVPYACTSRTRSQAPHMLQWSPIVAYSPPNIFTDSTQEKASAVCGMCGLTIGEEAEIKMMVTCEGNGQSCKRYGTICFVCHKQASGSGSVLQQIAFEADYLTLVAQHEAVDRLEITIGYDERRLAKEEQRISMAEMVSDARIMSKHIILLANTGLSGSTIEPRHVLNQRVRRNEMQLRRVAVHEKTEARRRKRKDRLRQRRCSRKHMVVVVHSMKQTKKRRRRLTTMMMMIWKKMKRQSNPI